MMMMMMMMTTVMMRLMLMMIALPLLGLTLDSSSTGWPAGETVRPAGHMGGVGDSVGAGALTDPAVEA
eukprot:scaffold3302_cov335-Prasinococcus_capsulatus_cf.AAC.1